MVYSRYTLSCSVVFLHTQSIFYYWCHQWCFVSFANPSKKSLVFLERSNAFHFFFVAFNIKRYIYTNTNGLPKHMTDTEQAAVYNVVRSPTLKYSPPGSPRRKPSELTRSFSGGMASPTRPRKSVNIAELARSISQANSPVLSRKSFASTSTEFTRNTSHGHAPSPFALRRSLAYTLSLSRLDKATSGADQHTAESNI